MGIFRYNIKIRFSEVGIDNCLSPKGFLRYLQEVAIMHSDSLGYGVSGLSQKHLAWVITNWKIKLFSKPVSGTEITIKTWVRSFIKFFAYRDFEVVDSNGNIMSEAKNKLEKCLVYVSITRARKEAYITYYGKPSEVLKV